MAAAENDSCEKNTDDHMDTSSISDKEGDLKFGFSSQKSDKDDDYVLISNTEKNAPESINDDVEDTYYNRASDNERKQTETSEDISEPMDEQMILSTSASTDKQDWKCRECGFVNKCDDTICETCESPKPMRPCLETRQSYVQRSPSVSPTSTRSSTPDRENPQSASLFRPIDSSRDQSPSNLDLYTSKKSTQSNARRRSSNSYSSDDNQGSVSSDIKTRRQSSRSPSKDKLSTDRFTFSNRNDTLSNDHRSDYNPSRVTHKDEDEDVYRSYGSSGKKSVTNATTSYSSPAAESLNRQTSSSILRFSDEYDRKPAIDDQKTTSRTNTSDRDSSVYEFNEYDKRSNKLYPDLKLLSSASNYTSNTASKENEKSPHYQYLNKQKSSVHSLISPSEDKNDRSQRTTEKPNSSSIRKSERDTPNVVYIPDLPVNSPSSAAVENMIRECLEVKHRQKVLGVKCDTQLGIGIVYLPNDDDKKHLTDVLQKIIIEPSNKITVSFVDELELISYVVIDSKDAKSLPSMNDVGQRWTQLHKVNSQLKCEQLSIQFPNIFRITIHSLDELTDAMSIKDFTINEQMARVYFRADCCFFEDLPRTTNSDRIKEAINKLIVDEYMTRECMYIHYNKDAANAVVITSGKARIWSLHNSIQLDGREIMKKDSLACRLLLSNVPKEVSQSLIRDHKLFNGSVTKILSGNNDVILELSDKETYDKCIHQGALSIGGHALRMQVSTLSRNPEDTDIDDESWYETDMCDYTKPNIMTFMCNPRHPIFRYKWNAKAFLDQFHRWTSNDNKEGKDEKLSNLKRHQLRMTVMLNTIGIVKRDYYRIGEKEIKLKPDRLKTIVYNYKSKLQHGKTMPLSQVTNVPYSHTSVKVINEDCLIAYRKLVSQGHRPVILNMANAHNAGGGYRRGDGAQEETLFRRSNYYQSLDRELDDGKPSARFRCTSNCDLDPLNQCDQLYPMDDFGAIYTSGLTVFRQPEETGYTFMDIPMYDVCAIAMAAYRDPKVDKNNLLTSQYSIDTRKKIENIFAIACHHKHDSLVLSALGCGAFRNPPKHVATIFKSVIEQYAGFFKCIYFAVIDDHNTGQDFNPNGNYHPFQKILDHLDVEPKKHQMLDMMIGPWRILKQTTNKEVTLSDIKICHLKPCHYGGICSELRNEQHCREYSHPPLCPSTDYKTGCKEKNDDQHLLWYRHRLKCSKGGECELVDKDPMHSNEFEHPEFCRDEGGCENLHYDHLKLYRHVPLCKHRRECLDYNRKTNDHCENFRHCIPMCRFDKYCVRFHDDKHMKEENHSFQPPCPFTPFHCRYFNTLSQAKQIKTLPTETQNHCLHYSHVCRFGRQCRETSDVHWKNTIHVAREMCSHGDKCTKLHQEEHLNSFSHPGIADIRRLCNHSGCDCRDKQKSEHMKQYRHDGNHDRSGVINYFGQNKAIHFVNNQENIVKAITEYASHIKQTLTVSKEIQKFVQSLQPVHRCSNVIFESILVHGHVMSSEHMEHLQKPRFAAQAVYEHKHVQAIFNRYKMTAIEDYAKEYIRAIVSQIYAKKYAGGGIVIEDPSHPRATSMSTASDDHDNTIHLNERFLKNLIKPEEIDTIRKRAISIAEASWNLHTDPTGIKYSADKALGTNKHVFSILGPHRGHYYGDIVLVFKSEVMLHPDANFSPQAATSFNSGRTFSNRPWVKDPKTESERVKCFHESKLHCSIPGYEYAAAAELIAITGLHKKTLDVNVGDILNRWKKVDSHDVFEAHLPQLVPLNYVDEVYIPKTIFDSLTPAAQVSARKIFRSSLHITDHHISIPPIGGRHELDTNRSKYLEDVMKKLIEKIENQMKCSKHCNGTVITVAPSQFSEHIVIPLTIDKAYDQYRRAHKQTSNSDDVYIYWQAMYGDMMVTLANEAINPERPQPNIRCLVCYIAERPSTTTTNYTESYSYINAGEPYRHSVIKITGQCSSSSHSFHRGCDIDDFMIYCLKIEKKTGQVTLSHAGSNSIYCYEKITCNFPKTTLDLNKLRYVHVSAGSQKVPIRNLIISFQPIPDLHPSIDKNFKPENERKPRRKTSRSPDHSNASKREESPRKKSPSFLKKAVNYVGNLLGIEDDDKKLEPCPASVNCSSQNSSKHMEEKSHPCRYSELCRNKDKEPHLTHEPHRVKDCPHEAICQKLDDVVHRAQYRHKGYPDFLIPCRNETRCSDKTLDH